MPKVLLERPTGFWGNSHLLPVAAQMAGYEYWDEGKKPDPLLVLRDGDHYVVVREWRTPPSLTELREAVRQCAASG